MQNILTAAQKKTLWDEQGNVLHKNRIKLTARPGTGKTHTLTQYCIDLARQWPRAHASWEGIAILSYTRVAKREIEKRIAQMEDGYEILSYPHYIGTLDSFINNYIFLPFGARLMGCSSRPVLIGEPFSSGKTVNQTTKNAYGGVGYFDYKYYYYHSSYGLDNKLYLIGAQKDVQANGSVCYYDSILQVKISSWIKVDGSYNVNSQKIHDEKQRRFIAGYATQADANYIAYRLLNEFDDIRDMLVARFPCLLIDEAQDMTELQHAIVDLLCKPAEKSLENCILIGDDAQAIYEWNTARPDLFTDKTGFDSRQLTETFRCSQNICNILNKLDDSYPLNPAGKNLNYQDAVIRKDWGAGDRAALKSIVEEFIQAISEKDEPHDSSHDYFNVAVLARSRKLAPSAADAYFDTREGEFGHFATFDEASTKDLLRIAHYLNSRSRNLSKAFTAYETYWCNKYDLKNKESTRLSIGRAIFGDQEYNIAEYRRAIFAYMEKLQDLTENMSRVCDFNNDSLEVLADNGFPDISLNIVDAGTFSTRNDGDTSLDSLFANNPEERMPHIVQATNGKIVYVTIGTIHSVKGETYDGVLYLSKDKTEFCKDVCPKNQNNKRTREWVDIVDHDILKCESKRLLYVALSRAAQVLWLAGEEAFSAIAQ